MARRLLALGASLLATCALLSLPGCSTPVRPTAGGSVEPASRAASGAALGPGGAPAVSSGGGGSSSGGFFPLDLGDRWIQTTSTHFRLVPDDPAQAPSEFTDSSRSIWEMVCSEPIGDRTYMVQRELPEHDGFVTWDRYRQDASGLYLADIEPARDPVCDPRPAESARRALSDPARTPDPAWEAIAGRISSDHVRAAFRQAWGRVRTVTAVALRSGRSDASPAAASDAPGEIRLLAYPPHPGARWVSRTDPTLERRVEAVDVLQFPFGNVSAYRVRTTADFLGPRDSILEWDSRAGQLRLTVHAEAIATDSQGRRYGVIIADSEQRVESLSLVRGRFTEPGRGGSATAR